MFCSKCGKQIDEDSSFCPYCGSTAGGSSVPKDSGKQEKNQDKATIKQRANKPLPVKLIAGGVVAVALLIVCIIIFRPAGNRKIEDSFLGRMFSLSWGEITDMSARDFRNLFKEEDISYTYDEDSSSGWSLAAKETSRFMGSDAMYGIGFDEGNYIQEFIMLYETRDDCKDSFEDIKKYLDNNLVKNTTAVDLLSTGSDVLFDEKLDALRNLKGMDLRDNYVYFLDKSSDKEDLDKYYELSIKKAEQKGKELSDEEKEDLRKEIDESVIYKKVALLRSDLDDVSDILQYMSLDDASYSKSICILAVEYELQSESSVTSAFTYFGWDSVSGKEIDVDKTKTSLDADFQAVAEEMVDGIAVSIAKSLDRKYNDTPQVTYLESETLLILEGGGSSVNSGTQESKEDKKEDYPVSDEVREVAETAVYSILYMMDKHNFDAFEGQYIDKKNKNYWYITSFEYDMDKGEAVDLSKYADSTGVYCAVEYNYDVRNSEKFASDLDREIYLASMGYDINTGKEIALSGYMNSGGVYCAVNYNYDVSESDYFASDLDRNLYLAKKRYDAETKAPLDLTKYQNSVNVYCAVNYNYNVEESEYFASELDTALYLADKDYNMDTGESFGSTDIMRLWFLLRFSYDIDSGEIVEEYANKSMDKKVANALVAYQKCMSSGDIMFGENNDSIADFAQGGYGDLFWCLAYIDEDDIPELVLQINAGISTWNLILSYHNGNLITNELYSNYGSISYVEKRNIFEISEGRMGYYSDTFYNLIEGEVVILAEGYYHDKYENGNYVVDENGTMVQEYFWNDVECSEDDYYNMIHTLIDSAGDTAEWKEAPSYNESYSDILSAFNVL